MVLLSYIHSICFRGHFQSLLFGCRVASKLEWTVLYILARDGEGYLSKEAIRRCFDGSLFDYCAKMQMGAEGKMK